MSIATSADPRPIDTPMTMPSAPDTTSVRSQIAARLHAIEMDALPALAARRELLERVWRTESPDAVLLYAHGYEVIPTDAAGADRLAMTLAEQHALTLEAEALRELALALDRYDGGGSALATEVDGTDVNLTQLVNSPTLAPLPQVVAGDERAHTLAMLRYLAEVRQEVWAARRACDDTRRQQLEAESRALEARIRERSAAMRGASSVSTASVLSQSA